MSTQSIHQVEQTYSAHRVVRYVKPHLAGVLIGCLLPLLLLLTNPSPSAAQSTPSAQAGGEQRASLPRDLLWVLPRAPLGVHCIGSVVCTDLGTWGIHARLTGSTLIRSDGALPGGMLTPAASLTFGGWGEAGVHFPLLLGPLGTEPLPLPPLLFVKGAFTPPSWIGTHGILFATLTLPGGPFSAPDDSGQPMHRSYEMGAALSGHLFRMLHYGLSISGQITPGGAPSRLFTGIEIQARFDGFRVFAQPLHSAAFCERGAAGRACQSSVAVLLGLQIPLVAGHSSAATGPTRGAGDQDGTLIEATVGASYDEATRAKYGDGIAKMKQFWKHLFTTVIDPYLDERCILWDDDHRPMVELGNKSTDGRYCERNGLRAPINTHFDRNKASTLVCYDAGLRNCILRRDSDKDPWQVVPAAEQARRPYLKEDCHVYESGVMLPLQQVGFRSTDGKACEWRGYRFPIGTEFWAVPGDDVLCEDATLKKCSIELPAKPMTTGQYVGSRAEQGLVRGVTHLVETFERGPQVAADLASGKLHVGTVAGEAYAALKNGLGHLTLEDAEKEAVAIVEAGREWLDEPLHQQLGDIAEAVGELPAKVLENEATAGVGSLGSGIGGAARVGSKIEKAAVKTERTAVKAEHAAADAAKAGHASRRAESIVADHTAPPHPSRPQNASRKVGTDRHGDYTGPDGTVHPGGVPSGETSIPLDTGPSRSFRADQRRAVNQLGDTHGCVGCSTKDPGTKPGRRPAGSGHDPSKGNFVIDHEPPVSQGGTGPYQGRPHCLTCSNKQGGSLSQEAKKRGPE